MAKKSSKPLMAHDEDKLEEDGVKTYCGTISEIAAHFAYSDPTNFRRTVLEGKYYPFKRVGPKRIIMRKKDIPGF